jgi:hypothetical protein
MRSGMAPRVGVAAARETKTQYRSAERLAGISGAMARDAGSQSGSRGQIKFHPGSSRDRYRAVGGGGRYWAAGGIRCWGRGGVVRTGCLQRGGCVDRRRHIAASSGQ